MTLQASGTIAIDDLLSEFGGPTPTPLQDYYRGGSYVPNTSNNNSVPTLGAIALESFYSASNNIAGSISGGGSVSNTSGTGTFSLSASTNFNTPSYAWTTSAGTLSSTTVAAPTLTLTAAAGASTAATVTCTISCSGKSIAPSTTCTYDNSSSSETVSISGGGTASNNTGSYAWDLTASGSPTTPSAYAWTANAGSFNTTTGASVVFTLTTPVGTTTTATITCNMTVNGTVYTATTTCTYTYNTSCFSGCTRILTDQGYVRFDQLPSEFYVINHTGKHLAKLLVHENSTEPMRRMGEHLVTERHLMKVGDEWVAARDLFHEPVSIEPRTVYNCHVLSENTDDHHYLLENGLTAHNAKVS